MVKCYRAQDPWAILGMWLYLFGMGGSYLSSTLYHSLKHHNPWKRRLRHWDHAAIYWHIAGSFSPVTLIALRDEGLWGWGLMMLFAKKVAAKIKQEIACKRVAVVALGLEVPHAHIHLIPIQSENDVDFHREKLKLTPEEFREIAAKLFG